MLRLGDALMDRLVPPDGTPLAAPRNTGIRQAFAGVSAERGVDSWALKWGAKRPGHGVLLRPDAFGDEPLADSAGAGPSSGGGMRFADQVLNQANLFTGLGNLLATGIRASSEAGKAAFDNDWPQRHHIVGSIGPFQDRLVISG